MAGIGWSTSGVSSITNPKVRRERSDLGNSTVAGQFQTSASGFLWTYTEEYLHNGIKMRRLSDQEKKELGLDVSQTHGKVIIPSPDDDFRGIIGDVERAVSAWDPKFKQRQNDPRQTLPLFRLMTWIDPYFVEAWTTGAMVIGMDYRADSAEKALQFLREGMDQNPDCVDIPMMFGMMEVTRKKDFRKGERFFLSAIRNGKSRFETLTENEKSALQNSYRWLALVYRNLGESAKLEKAANEGLQMFPDDLVIPSTRRPSIVPPTGYKPPIGVTSRRVQ